METRPSLITREITLIIQLFSSPQNACKSITKNSIYRGIAKLQVGQRALVRWWLLPV